MKGEAIVNDYVELQEVFQQFMRKMGDKWNKQMPKGIAKSHAFILSKLNENGPMKVSDLATSLCITPGGMTGLADKLLSLGYIKRKRSETDRRIVELEITGDGIEILQTIRKRNRQLIEKLFEGFTEDDATHLVKLIRQIIDNIDHQ